mmetsp:Transcript_13515/g.31094  ORF Transcript_13515/g.31094 Transcript_13515/m.31094 type:complete len:216 (-) Transcript_13515:678-1325(-)
MLMSRRIWLPRFLLANDATGSRQLVVLQSRSWKTRDSNHASSMFRALHDGFARAGAITRRFSKVLGPCIAQPQPPLVPRLASNHNLRHCCQIHRLCQYRPLHRARSLQEDGALTLLAAISNPATPLSITAKTGDPPPQEITPTHRATRGRLRNSSDKRSSVSKTGSRFTAPRRHPMSSVTSTKYGSPFSTNLMLMAHSGLTLLLSGRCSIASESQ